MGGGGKGEQSRKIAIKTGRGPFAAKGEGRRRLIRHSARMVKNDQSREKLGSIGKQRGG